MEEYLSDEKAKRQPRFLGNHRTTASVTMCLPSSGRSRRSTSEAQRQNLGPAMVDERIGEVLMGTCWAAANVIT